MAKHSLCSVEGCDKKRHARGFCKAHYKYWHRHGTPHPSFAANGDLPTFLNNAVAHIGGECLMWPFGKCSNGYAWVSSVGCSAHVYVCRGAHGEKPTNKHEVAHSCGNKSCVNPSHLRWATRAENAADREMHGTLLTGERSPKAKLTDAQVAEIRSLRGKLFQYEVADRFNVNVTTVNAIMNGRHRAETT